MINIPFIPFFPHSSTTSHTTVAGVTIIARSTTFGTSFIDLYAATPRILSFVGFTGYTTPL